MFDNVFEELLNKTWQRILDSYEYFTVPEWWVWLGYGLIVIGIASLLALFFQPLRPIAGAVFVAVLAALYGHHRGQQEEKRKQQERDDNG